MSKIIIISSFLGSHGRSSVRSGSCFPCESTFPVMSGGKTCHTGFEKLNLTRRKPVHPVHFPQVSKFHQTYMTFSTPSYYESSQKRLGAASVHLCCHCYVPYLPFFTSSPSSSLLPVLANKRNRSLERDSLRNCRTERWKKRNERNE